MKFYALVLWRTRGVVASQLKLLYLGDGEALTYAPDEAELVRFERTLQAIWTAIERAVATGDFRPNKTRLCDWCDHQAFCPAWGGTPPPFPLEAAAAAGWRTSLPIVAARLTRPLGHGPSLPAATTPAEGRQMRGYRADRAFDGTRVLADGALVLVDDGRIVGVEPASAPAPDGCEVVDFPSATLLPGLIDTHVHLCGDSGPRRPRPGPGAVRTTSSRGSSAPPSGSTCGPA